ncbi:hypothetical protein IFM89_019428 [Coptis chinensis]|uniref:Uncharacterized protein n=1 Tax=Coptis chinensis TaxID=261450 RepID=A0A835IRH9_9MAGN|nr:hypothetical protein IFM89_019428 [Coptis chinensis]
MHGAGSVRQPDEPVVEDDDDKDDDEGQGKWMRPESSFLDMEMAVVDQSRAEILFVISKPDVFKSPGRAKRHRISDDAGWCVKIKGEVKKTKAGDGDIVSPSWS